MYPKAEDKRPCAVYKPHKTEPTGTLEVASELEGYDVHEAVAFLQDFYEKVWLSESDYHPLIICHGPFDYDPDADYEELVEDGVEFEGEEDDGIEWEDEY